ncbi:MAG: hypothetical protein IPF93_13420 [Saprospiraceae bacterium]|nr:hypothetical protein [Saprospiraceae bacterium]
MDLSDPRPNGWKRVQPKLSSVSNRSVRTPVIKRNRTASEVSFARWPRLPQYEQTGQLTLRGESQRTHASYADRIADGVTYIP